MKRKMLTHPAVLSMNVAAPAAVIHIVVWYSPHATSTIPVMPRAPDAIMVGNFATPSESEFTRTAHAGRKRISLSGSSVSCPVAQFLGAVDDLRHILLGAFQVVRVLR